MSLPVPLHLREPLQALHGRLTRLFSERLRSLRIFGSAARYTASEHSDVDLAIIVEDLTHAEWDFAVGLVSEVSEQFDVPLSPFVVSASHFELLSNRGRAIARDIIEEGISA